MACAGCVCSKMNECALGSSALSFAFVHSHGPSEIQCTRTIVPGMQGNKVCRVLMH